MLRLFLLLLLFLRTPPPQIGGRAAQRMKKRPPRGMFLSHQDVLSLSSSTPQGLIRQLDSQVVSIKRQVRPGPPVTPNPPAERSFTCPSLSDPEHQADQQLSEGEPGLGGRRVQAARGNHGNTLSHRSSGAPAPRLHASWSVLGHSSVANAQNDRVGFGSIVLLE